MVTPHTGHENTIRTASPFHATKETCQNLAWMNRREVGVDPATNLAISLGGGGSQILAVRGIHLSLPRDRNSRAAGHSVRYPCIDFVPAAVFFSTRRKMQYSRVIRHANFLVMGALRWGARENGSEIRAANR